MHCFNIFCLDSNILSPLKHYYCVHLHFPYRYRMKCGLQSVSNPLKVFPPKLPSMFIIFPSVPLPIIPPKHWYNGDNICILVTSFPSLFLLHNQLQLIVLGILLLFCIYWYMLIWVAPVFPAIDHIPLSFSAVLCGTASMLFQKIIYFNSLNFLSPISSIKVNYPSLSVVIMIWT